MGGSPDAAGAHLHSRKPQAASRSSKVSRNVDFNFTLQCKSCMEADRFELILCFQFLNAAKYILLKA